MWNQHLLFEFQVVPTYSSIKILLKILSYGRHCLFGCWYRVKPYNAQGYCISFLIQWEILVSIQVPLSLISLLDQFSKSWHRCNTILNNKSVLLSRLLTFSLIVPTNLSEHVEVYTSREHEDCYLIASLGIYPRNACREHSDSTVRHLFEASSMVHPQKIFKTINQQTARTLYLLRKRSLNKTTNDLPLHLISIDHI